jgi:hypothetical protein
MSRSLSACLDGVVTWLLAIGAQLGQLINDGLELLCVASSNCPLQVVWQVSADPLGYKLASVAGSAEEDELVLARLLSHCADYDLGLLGDGSRRLNVVFKAEASWGVAGEKRFRGCRTKLCFRPCQSAERHCATAASHQAHNHLIATAPGAHGGRAA